MPGKLFVPLVTHISAVHDQDGAGLSSTAGACAGLVATADFTSEDIKRPPPSLFHICNFCKGYLLGNALIFLGTLGNVFYNSYSRNVLERYSPLEVLFYTYVGMFIIMTPLVLSEEGSVFRHIPSFTARTWIGLALLTFFHNFLSMVQFLKALKQLDAIQAALSNYLITFFGIPIGVVWLGERLAPLALIGGIIIVGSTLLIAVWYEEGPRAEAAAAGPSAVE